MPKAKLLLFFLICFPVTAHAAQWFCKEGASSKINNTYEVCGIGEEVTENEARKTALKNAFEEFDLVCNRSDDCRNKYKQISPLRTDCDLNEDKYKCYRAFYITVDSMRTSTSLQSVNLASDLEVKEKIVESSTYFLQNAELIERLAEVEKLSQEIRENIRDKNQIVEKYLKRGMTLKEVMKIIHVSSGLNKYIGLNGDDYFIYGIYKLQFNPLEDIGNGPILESACDMNIPERCVNLEL